jgi:hypothetical protein
MEFGGIAQLGERLPCKQEVNGSIPFVSTKLVYRLRKYAVNDTETGMKTQRFYQKLWLQSSLWMW